MTSMEKDDLLRLLGEVVADADFVFIERLEMELNEPTRIGSSHSAYDWFLILKERLNP